MVILQQVLNGLSFGALLFLLASGFTLVFGLMRIANLAHGAFYLLGGYVGVVVTATTGNLAAGLVAAAIIVALLATGVERVLLVRVRGNELAEVLLTIGVAFIVADICLAIFGGNPMSLSVSEWLKGSLTFGPMPYPKYRLFIIGFTVLVGIALYLFQQRSRLGAMIRAGVDDREIAAPAASTSTGSWPACSSWVACSPAWQVSSAPGSSVSEPGADVDILLFAMVVVIIGGLGSIKGAAVGSVLIGVIDATSRVWFPEFSYFTIFAPMALVLVLRPTGLFGRQTLMRFLAKNGRRWKLVGLVVGIGAAWSVPYVFSNYMVSVASLILISAMLATSVNFMAGNVNLVSVGHAGIAATAGYGLAGRSCRATAW